MRREKVPKNVFVQNGRLFFRKRINGVSYNAALEMVDNAHNRRQAKYIVEEIDAATKRGVFDPCNYPFLKRYHRAKPLGTCPTFEEYVDIWLKKKSLLAPATYRTYKGIIDKHLMPQFVGVPIDQIDKLVVERWQQQLAQRLSRVYANECLRRLKSILTEAEADYRLTLFVNKVKPLRNYQVAETIEDKIFTLEEASKLYCVMGTRLRTMMLCSMFAGLRTGEVIALKRENIDFERNRLKIRANMSGGIRQAPKTAAAVRNIDMHPVLRKHLAEHLNSHDHDFVFISNQGLPFSRIQNFEREYRLAKEKAGVRDLRWYAFRKLFASMRYACEDDVPAMISNDMGHTDIALGLNTYAKAMPHLGCKFEDIQFPIIGEAVRGQAA